MLAACLLGHLDVCRVLVTDGGADVNVTAGEGTTPLYAASELG